ncbi:membrane-bound lytic murein transglycosylase MltF [Gilvimarinus xylanilyticus]|uniref:Membrane-bound lytic murein transglycosylase F n=1 Tax=Gilvimarinus xylanilyticus TaxID=2944139 RepID=A0A9X2HVJ0_9GAMM|nr:membrane-bound lytic murein transglycosylase MltF [Gilvimarinus xylanilyticus]MCP8897804.1 membrane-bound lytic murein transglycosylase MltF [Gilvimarinus xylanilyticus]
MQIQALGNYWRGLPGRIRPKRLLFSSVLLALALLLSASRPPTELEALRESGTLVAISRNGPTTYYEGPEGRTGFEYLLLQGFADYLGVELEIREQESLNKMIRQVANGEAHLAAAGLTVTPQRAQTVRFSPTYLKVTQQLLYRRGTLKPETLGELEGELLVIEGSSHAERLQALKAEYPDLHWREQENLEMIDLMEMVHRGEVDYAMVDSNAYQTNSHIFPKARVAFDLGEPENLAWAFAQGQDNSLFAKAQTYLTEIRKDGSLKALVDELFNSPPPVSTGGALLFTHRIDNRLPQWQELIQTVADEVGLDWQLLAAMSYQESHWDPDAVSHTGVRGLMMLTRTTARELGIKNRQDPKQSMRGGALYFKRLYDRLPQRITDPDRTLLALAAYNVGMSHLEDARILTQRHGGNPDIWVDVEQHLPLLAKRKYYRTLSHGYARGWEPVHYVNNILRYRDIIAWHEQQEQRRLAMAEGTDLTPSEQNDEDEAPDESAPEKEKIAPLSIL